MSKLEQLIEELCPDGVEYVYLKNVIISLKTGLNPRKNFILNTKDAINYYVTVREIVNGKVVFFDKTDKINDEGLLLINNRSNLEKGDILFSGTGTVGRTAVLEDSPINWNIKEGIYAMKPNQEIICSKYLGYILNSSDICSCYSKKIVGSPVCSLPMAELKKIQIPLPPLQVQHEIVRILDTFSEYTTELTEELTMRKKQYEYYRDNLFSFDSCEYEQRLLGEIGEVRMCKRILKEQTLDIGDIPFYKIGTFGKEANAYISQELFEEYKSKYNYPKIGDVLISASGTIGRTVVFDGKDAYFQDSNIVWIENDESIVLNKYLFHFYKIAKWYIAEGGTIQRLYNDNLKKTNILVPYPNDKEKSLTEQQRIVDILDRFDTLYNDISKGLPGEIEARQKQYKYYRDKLLTFKNIND